MPPVDPPSGPAGPPEPLDEADTPDADASRPSTPSGGDRRRHSGSGGSGLRTSGELSPATFAKLAKHLASLDDKDRPAETGAAELPDTMQGSGFGFSPKPPNPPPGAAPGAPRRSPLEGDVWSGAPTPPPAGSSGHGSVPRALSRSSSRSSSRTRSRSSGSRPPQPLGTIGEGGDGFAGGGGSGSGSGSGGGIGGGGRRPSGTGGSSRRRRKARKQLFRRRSRARKFAIWSMLGLGALVIVFGLMVADAYYQSLKIYDSLKDVPALVSAARADLERGELPQHGELLEASGDVGDAQARVQQAGFVFHFVRSLPMLGRPVKAITLATDAASKEADAARIVQGLIVKILGPDPGASGTAPVFHDGVIDIGVLQSVAPSLDKLVADLRAADASIRAIPNVPFVHKLDDLKTQVLSESAQAIALSRRAVASFKLLPDFLGADGPKTYYLAMQNNDDQRGTGGAVLAFALIRIDNGHITRLQDPPPGPIADIDPNKGGFNTPLTPPAAWYLNATGAVHRLANGANYSPDFPSAAKSWQGMLASPNIGVHVDGVIAIDPYAVAAALTGQKAIPLQGYPDVPQITSENLVQFVMQTQYTLDKGVQRLVPALLINSAYEAITNPTHFFGLLHHLSGALAAKHLQVWSANPDVEALVSQLGWDGAIHNSGGGDYLNLAYNKRIGNKIDYYAQQSVNYDVTVEPSGGIRSSYSMDLSLGSMPTDLPTSIVGQAQPYGVDLAMLSLYVPGNARFSSVSPSGPFPPDTIVPSRLSLHVIPKSFVQHVETNGGGSFRVFTQTILAYQSHDAGLRFDYTVPGVIKETPQGKVYTLTVQNQPLVLAQQLSVTLHLPKGSQVVSLGAGWTQSGDTVIFHGQVTNDFTTSVVFR